MRGGQGGRQDAPSTRSCTSFWSRPAALRASHMYIPESDGCARASCSVWVPAVGGMGGGESAPRTSKCAGPQSHTPNATSPPDSQPRPLRAGPQASVHPPGRRKTSSPRERARLSLYQVTSGLGCACTSQGRETLLLRTAVTCSELWPAIRGGTVPVAARGKKDT